MGEQFKWNPSNERVGQMLRQAVYMEDQVTLEHLVKQKADLESKDETGATPLQIAASQSRPSTISWLVSHRADIGKVDAEGFSALTWACVKGHRAAVAQLLTCRADAEAQCEANGKIPLSLCAERGHKECITELLDRRAGLEHPNRDGTLPLMCAAHHNETEVIAYLLSRNCIVNATDGEGWNALMYAVNAPVPAPSLGGEAGEKKVHLDGSVGKKHAAELLLLHKADINAQSTDGLSPLLICAGHDRPLAVRRLLENKAEVNLCSQRGQSPLLMASAHDLPNVVRALIMANAEVNHTNVKGKSSLALAEEFKYIEVADLLKKAGATAMAVTHYSANSGNGCVIGHPSTSGWHVVSMPSLLNSKAKVVRMQVDCTGPQLRWQSERCRVGSCHSWCQRPIRKMIVVTTEIVGCFPPLHSAPLDSVCCAFWELLWDWRCAREACSH